MEMAKVNWNLDYNEKIGCMVNGVDVNVFQHIPYEKKVEFAEEYSSLVCVLDEDGTAGINPYSEMYWAYCVLKYYTDIEINEDDNAGWIYDFVVEYDLLEKIRDIAKRDYFATYEFATNLVDFIVESWKQSHSLAGTMARLTSDEEMKKLSEAAPLNNELIDLLHMKQDMESGNKVVPLAEFAKKDKD